MTTPEDRIELVFNGLKRKRQLPDSVGALEHFPFTDFADAKSRINDGEYLFLRGIITPSLFDVLASRTEKIVRTLSTLAFCVGVLILLVGSFIVDNFYLLLGYLLFPLLLLFTTNQLDKMARFVLVVLIGGLAIAVVTGNADLQIVLLSFSVTVRTSQGENYLLSYSLPASAE